MRENNLERRDLENWYRTSELRGFKRADYNPPIDRFLMALGFVWVPFIFWPFKRIVLVTGLGAFMGCALVLLLIQLLYSDRNPIDSIIICKVIFGAVLIGFMMALVQRRKRVKMKLTTWEDFLKSL